MNTLLDEELAFIMWLTDKTKEELDRDFEIFQTILKKRQTPNFRFYKQENF